MSVRRCFRLAATLALAACGADEADQARAAREARPAPEARYADVDRDGTVTRQEAAADPVLARHFGRYDVNGDGALDRAEFARLEAHAAARRDERERQAIPQPYSKPK